LHPARPRDEAFDNAPVTSPARAAARPGPAAPSTTPSSAAPPALGRPVRARRTDSGFPDAIVLALVLAVPIAVTVLGFSYYVAPLAGRVRSPLHALLRPSGPVGLTFGVAGFCLFLFMWLYPLRKTVRWLAWTGQVGSWMRVHIVAGLVIPVIVAVHAGWRFDGIIGLGYMAMFTVSLSGIVGRYLYVHIPRSRDGLEMTRSDVEGERRALVTRIAAATDLEPRAVERALAMDTRSYEGLDPLRTLWRMVQDDMARTRALEALRRTWSAPRPGAEPPSRKAMAEVMKLARRQMSLSQQMRMLEATRTVFGYWHVAHRPFAITALLAVVIHVVVALVVGVVRL
jgi:hypothetical protein